MADVMTYDEAHYLDIGDTDTPNIQLMSVGITQMDENANPIESSKQYIGDVSKTNRVTGYDDEFPLNSDFISSDAVVLELYTVFRDRSTGTAAQKDHYIVELWNNVSDTTYTCRKHTCSVVINSKVANPGEQITFTGSLKGVGDFTEGTFDTATKTFTATGASV